MDDNLIEQFMTGKSIERRIISGGSTNARTRVQVNYDNVEPNPECERINREEFITQFEHVIRDVSNSS